MDKKEVLRSIPKIDEVLKDQRLFVFFGDTARELIVDSVRETIDEIRKDILDHFEKEDTVGQNSNQKMKGGESSQCQNDNNMILTYNKMMDKILERLIDKRKKSLRRTINATGVTLHTNLGRAKLSDKACEAVMDIAGNYSTLEYDVKKGARGSRHDHVEKIITRITGAEAAMVVNNNAAATMICLSAMAKDKEVIVSRGELVEIGGSFRVPEIMQQSGAILKEIGTTNKTKVQDYKNAINENTGVLLKVHTSNYKILGFTAEASLVELVELGKEEKLPVIYDMGSGLMVDLKEYGIAEPTVLDSLKTGIDIILFSGDKLLGGPQGGIIIGKKEYVDRMKKHPLARILRVDKMTLAAMEATFNAYLNLEEAKNEIPVLSMLCTSKQDLKVRAERLKEKIEELDRDNSEINMEIVETKEQVGGGSAPITLLDGYALAITSEYYTADKLERRLRESSIPIIARIYKNHLYIDMRTVTDEESDIIAQAIAGIKKGRQFGDE